jgi:rod shape determining protein RodA
MPLSGLKNPMNDLKRLLNNIRYDRPLMIALLVFAIISLVVLYSASGKNLSVVASQAIRLTVAYVIMLLIAQMRPDTLVRYSPHFFAAGLALLVIVLIVGVVGKGAQRWISLGGFSLQPSELMKLSVPMIVAWWLARDGLPPKLGNVGIAAVLIFIPVLLIIKQPDLGTATLILASGLIVIFLAGLSWRVITVLVMATAAVMPLVWANMHDYQRQRVISFLNPESDPLGAGYHSIQSMIAVGSGGFFGKGWLDSSQAHLGYLPESKTDFVFAVFAEEFGMLGAMLLFGMYLFVIGRGMYIAYNAQDAYSRLLAGSLILTFFLYFFVNIGMVTGILPVVGVPLPLISHGGSSLVTLMAAFGILMSIQTHRRIVQ